MAHSTGYNELVAALQQLQGQLNKNGLASLAGRVTNVQSLLLGPVVARALQIRSAVLQRRRPRTENAIRTNAKALAKEVSFLKPPASEDRFSSTTLKFKRFSFTTCSVWRCWRSQVHLMPLNFVIYNQHMKWKDCWKHTILSRPEQTAYQAPQYTFQTMVLTWLQIRISPTTIYLM